MGLIHSRASKARARAEAKVLNEEARAARDKRLAEPVDGRPWWLQPTLTQAIQALRNRT